MSEGFYPCNNCELGKLVKAPHKATRGAQAKSKVVLKQFHFVPWWFEKWVWILHQSHCEQCRNLTIEDFYEDKPKWALQPAVNKPRSRTFKARVAEKVRKLIGAKPKTKVERRVFSEKENLEKEYVDEELPEKEFSEKERF